MRNFLFFLLISGLSAQGQTTLFSGSINKVPVEMVTYSFPDGVTRLAYSYTKFDSPIGASGIFRDGTLVAVEDNGGDSLPSVFELVSSPNNEKELKGKWVSYSNRLMMDVELVKSISFDSYDDTQFEGLEIMQLESTREHYFMVVLDKEQGDGAVAVGVKVYEKGTDTLLQEFSVECQYIGLENIKMGDFNFDGQMDFSMFESSYSGANTSSIYFLKNSTTGKFEESDISGSSLEFDSEKKLIIERNQCCAGSQEFITSYKWVNNVMVRLEKKCFIYNEEAGGYEETKCDN
ncbi:MAG: hypothetical protein ACI9YL_001282 [Luteibaculaceae bacterium]|jgi:hypothetical protein